MLRIEKIFKQLGISYEVFGRQREFWDGKRQIETSYYFKFTTSNTQHGEPLPYDSTITVYWKTDEQGNFVRIIEYLPEVSSRIKEIPPIEFQDKFNTDREFVDSIGVSEGNITRLPLHLIPSLQFVLKNEQVIALERYYPCTLTQEEIKVAGSMPSDLQVLQIMLKKACIEYVYDENKIVISRDEDGEDIVDFKFSSQGRLLEVNGYTKY